MNPVFQLSLFMVLVLHCADLFFPPFFFLFVGTSFFWKCCFYFVVLYYRWETCINNKDLHVLVRDDGNHFILRVHRLLLHIHVFIWCSVTEMQFEHMHAFPASGA